MEEKKKNKNLMLLASALFFIAAILGFADGNTNTAVVWMCLGSAFLCFGAETEKKTEDGPDASIQEIILASGSPRRKELLERMGIPFRVIKSECEEITTKKKPQEVVKELSRQKAQDVYDRLSAADRAGRVVLGADTVVSIHGKILGKPKDAQDAIAMLGQLSGQAHHVYTGVTVLWEDSTGKLQSNTFYEDTKVEMYPMSSQQIEEYVAGGEPMDKAGAYGIQGDAMVFIRKIHGDYNNVVGLPVARLYHELAGVSFNSETEETEE